MIDMQKYYMSKIAAPVKQDDIKTGFDDDKTKKPVTAPVKKTPSTAQKPLSAGQSRLRFLRKRDAHYTGMDAYNREIGLREKAFKQRQLEYERSLDSNDLEEDDRKRIYNNYVNAQNRLMRLRDKFDTAYAGGADDNMSGVNFHDFTNDAERRYKQQVTKATGKLIDEGMRARDEHEKRYGGLGGYAKSVRDDALSWGRGMTNSLTFGLSNALLNQSDYVNSWADNVRHTTGNDRFLKRLGMANTGTFRLIPNWWFDEWNPNKVYKRIEDSGEAIRYMDNKYLTPAQQASKEAMNAQRIAEQYGPTSFENWGQGLTDVAMLAVPGHGAYSAIKNSERLKAIAAPLARAKEYISAAKPEFLTNVSTALGKYFPTVPGLYQDAKYFGKGAINVLRTPGKWAAEAWQPYANSIRLAGADEKLVTGLNNLRESGKLAKILKQTGAPGKAILKIKKIKDVNKAVKQLQRLSESGMEGALQAKQILNAAYKSNKGIFRRGVGSLINTGMHTTRAIDANNTLRDKEGVLWGASQGEASDVVKNKIAGNEETRAEEAKNAAKWEELRPSFSSDEEASKTLGFTADGKPVVKSVSDYLSDIGSTITAHPYMSAAAAYMLYKMFSGGGYQMGPMGGYQMGPQQGGNIITNHPVLSTAALGAGAGYLANEGVFGDDMKNWWTNLMKGTPSPTKTTEEDSPLSEEAQAAAREKQLEDVSKTTGTRQGAGQ